MLTNVSKSDTLVLKKKSFQFGDVRLEEERILGQRGVNVVISRMGGER